jgi:shikimate dehydrogenase
MHNAAFTALGLDWRYDALPIRPGELKKRVPELVQAGYCGFNVTVPHKQEILRLPQIAEVENAVGVLKAANVLTVLPKGKLRAANTDWQGFAADLQAHDVRVNSTNCLVLGTGGSATAVAYALRKLGAATIQFVSRETGKVGSITYQEISVLEPAPDLIVNCTPVGMWPEVDASPWPDMVLFPSRAVLYDLIFNPPVTRLMMQARQAGAHVIGGLGMLVRQGALSFEQWTGAAPPLDVMEEAARITLLAR